jgi:hypothetical protein
MNYNRHFQLFVEEDDEDDEDLDDAEVSESEKQTMVSKISKYCITGPNDHGGVQLRLVQVKHEVADGYG